MVNISSWGKRHQAAQAWIPCLDRDAIPDLLKQNKPGLAYGMGRSYGDVCLNPKGVLWKGTDLDRLIQFDRDTGRLTCESGVLLRDIQRVAVREGWMLPVTPGTQFITVGGAIANDVHGKNQSLMGTFGHHVREITLLRTNGEVIHCGPQSQTEWFAATVGGLGLTGLILNAQLQLRKIDGAWLLTEKMPFLSLKEYWSFMADSNHEWEYQVAWVDCSQKNHRGVFMRANHALTPEKHSFYKRGLMVPFTPPVSLMNRLTVKCLNTLCFHAKKRKAGRSFMHYEPFFYPLDHIAHWNRVYGRKGFYQYQSVIPKPDAYQVIDAMLQTVTSSSEGSFLSVLKTFGEQESVGMLSFAQPGVTLALDFPNNGSKTLQLFDRLNAIVSEAGGRLYPAKDACMPRSLFIKGYPRLSEFLLYRDAGISSAMARRLLE